MTIESKKYQISDALSERRDRPSVGLIVLNTDFTFERDFVSYHAWKIIEEEVTRYFSSIYIWYGVQNIVKTYYEKMWLAIGRTIKFCQFVLGDCVSQPAPEEEDSTSSEESL